jgi:hypothetical protein
MRAALSDQARRSSKWQTNRHENPIRSASSDLIRNIHGVAEVAGLDGDELGYLLGKVAESRRIE